MTTQDEVLADNRKKPMKNPQTLELLVENECSGFVVRYDLDDYFVNFEVFGIVTTYEGKRQFHRRNAVDGTDTTPDFDLADVEMHGMIKWDGCSHASYPATYDCMHHLCGRADWIEWGLLFPALYDALAPKIPKYMASIAE